MAAGGHLVISLNSITLVIVVQLIGNKNNFDKFYIFTFSIIVPCAKQNRKQNQKWP